MDFYIVETENDYAEPYFIFFTGFIVLDSQRGAVDVLSPKSVQIE